MAAFSAIMRGMNILLSIAITTGILSGIWGWVAVSTELTKLGGLHGLYGLLCLPARWAERAGDLRCNPA